CLVTTHSTRTASAARPGVTLSPAVHRGPSTRAPVGPDRGSATAPRHRHTPPPQGGRQAAACPASGAARKWQGPSSLPGHPSTPTTAVHLRHGGTAETGRGANRTVATGA